MTRPIAWLIVSAALVGCTQSHTVGGDLGGSGGSIVRGCERQVAEADGHNSVPLDLSCTGLYADAAYKELSDTARTFRPAYPLWSDGSDKSRWVELPEGEQIDSSEPGSWIFPVGTKFWKEFRRDDVKVETRLYHKVADAEWRRGTYVWKRDGSQAKLLTGGTVTTLDGQAHDVPSLRQCDQCHKGSNDKVLGFEAVSLGLPGADQDGVTLQTLIDEDLLTDPPEDGQLELGDDGTGKAADPLGWMHTNCGVTCHNGNANAEARKTMLFMKLDPELLDGQPVNDFDTVVRTVNQGARTQQWLNQPRIVPGKVDDSLLLKLLKSREGGNRQMPPLATRIVDEENVAKVRDWIAAMPPSAAATGAEASE